MLLILSLVVLTAGAVTLASVGGPDRGEPWIVTLLTETFSAKTPTSAEQPEEVWIPPEKIPRPSSFDRPEDMRAVYLKAGEDFYITGEESAEDLMAQIDEALNLILDRTMNTVIIDPLMGDSLIHLSEAFHTIELPLDALEYISDQCRARGLYVYSIYYVLPDALTGRLDIEGAIDADIIDAVRGGADIFARRYHLNGVLLDNYFLMDKTDRYAAYLRHGSSIGYTCYMYDLSHSLFAGVVDIFTRLCPDMEIGLISEAVWDNAHNNPEGSATRANFTMYRSGHCDVKSYVEAGMVDFVAVRAFDTTTSAAEPYKAVVSWWSDLTADRELPLYMIHAAHKVGTSETGWDQYDQIPKQVIEAREHAGFSGSIFNSLTWLREDPQRSVSILLDMYVGKVRPRTILSELALTKPAQRTFTTLEPSVTFAGASDPNVEVTLNGQPIPIDENGYFSVTVDLDPGLNTYAFYNKGKTITYKITRRIEVIRPDAYGPLGTIEVDGGTRITITAVAYNDSKVYATIGGTRIELLPDEVQDDSTVTESAYWRYSGTYTAPEATDKEQNLGSIQLYGVWTWSGRTTATFDASYTLATVKVNKKLAIGDGRPVRVTAEVCETFPVGSVSDISDASYYPIPRGAVDVAVGGEILYRDGDKTYRYYNLASGVRVYSSDIEAIDPADIPGGNRITGYRITADSRYTTLTISMDQQVSYSAKYDRDSFSIRFNYTTSVPGSMTLDHNPLFGRADWNGVTLRLELLRRNVFMGYKAWYDGEGNLVLRFNNPPRVSGGNLSGVTVVLDPGHGGNDPGATGFLAAYPEKVINEWMAQATARALEARGATVIKLNTYSHNIPMSSRVAQARAANAHIFISIHANSAVRSSSRGTEVFYFNDYAYDLAVRAAKNIATAMGTTHRGAKFGLYHVTRNAQFPSILCEVGFMSNESDYYKMLSEDYHQAVGQAIANAVSGYLQAITPGSTATGTQRYGD
jgi:N-acetylmuramoyl-L-alanine amidase